MPRRDRWNAFTIRALVRHVLAWRMLAVAVGLLDFASTRKVIFADGISYLEIARNYAAGNWHLAINSYWSPLYSWFLALWRIVVVRCLPVRARDELELFGLHALNLAAYFVAWIAFERLLSRVDAAIPWKSEQSRSAFTFSAYCGFLCFAIWGIGMAFCAPDMIVLALVLSMANILMEIRAKPFRASRLALLGTVVAIAYLAKTAMLPAGTFFIACGVAVSRGRRLRATSAAVVACAAVATPWMVAVSAHQGHWTIGEAGKLNYAWEVDGASRVTNWQGEPGDIGTPLHPTRKILADPAVYEFAEPLRVTYSPWYDPAYWYAGVSPKIKPLAQLKTLLVYGRYSLLLLAIVPGLLVAAIAAAFVGSLRTVAGILLNFWYLLAPATATILLYCFVFVDSRYVAASVLIIGTIALAALTLAIHSKHWADGIKIEAALLVVLLLSKPVVTGLHSLISPATYAAPKQIEIAAEMRELGLSPGDRIGYIGMGINAYWALCDGVRIIAEVPMTYGRALTFERSIIVRVGKFNPLDSVIAAMKSAGARAVVADTFPAKPDLGDWHVLHVRDRSGLTGNLIMIRFLDSKSGRPGD